MNLVAGIALGVIIGISLGALGGGGSILTVPALVYVLGENAHAATTDSLVIVGVTAIMAAVSHARRGNVRWASGTVFGLIGVGASFLGTALNRRLDQNVLLLSFAVLLIVVAVAMLIRLRRTQPAVRIPERVGARVGGGVDVIDPDDPLDSELALGLEPEKPNGLTPAGIAKIIVAGSVVGFLTGFLGVGGGFIIVPALVMALGLEMQVAVGTSLLVIAINSAVALLARAGHQSFHWSIIVPFTVAAIVGSLFGRRIATRVRPEVLTRAFVVLLFGVAIYVTVRSVLAIG